jgi:hypothetical protein
MLLELTGDTYNNNSINVTKTSNSTSSDSIPVSAIRSNIWGRKKGSTGRQKAADKKKRDGVLARCKLLYQQERETAKNMGLMFLMEY